MVGALELLDIHYIVLLSLLSQIFCLFFIDTKMGHF